MRNAKRADVDNLLVELGADLRLNYRRAVAGGVDPQTTGFDKALVVVTAADYMPVTADGRKTLDAVRAAIDAQS